MRCLAIHIRALNATPRVARILKRKDRRIFVVFAQYLILVPLQYQYCVTEDTSQHGAELGLIKHVQELRADLTTRRFSQILIVNPS